MDYTIIGDRIRKIRKANGNLNQTQFGQIIGVSQDNVSLWERGKTAPTVDYIVAIIDKFTYDGERISADWILGVLQENRF